MHIHSKIVSFVHFMQLLLIFVAKFSRNSIRNIAEAKQRILVHLRAYDISASQCILEDLNSSQCTQCILVQIRSLRVNSDQFKACLVHSELFVRRTDGIVIIGHMSSKSTFGANKRFSNTSDLYQASAIPVNLYFLTVQLQ